MDGARERGEGGSERRKEGATERGRGAMDDRGKRGDIEGGKRQGMYYMYPEEDTGQYTVYGAQNNMQRGPRHCDFGITHTPL